MTADAIEVVADRLVDGPRETEEILRELAHRVREYGVIANERLASFVNPANGCADLARGMQMKLDHRDGAGGRIGRRHRGASACIGRANR